MAVQTRLFHWQIFTKSRFHFLVLMASPATQVLLDPRDKLYSAVFEAISSAHAVLADQYGHFVTLNRLMIRWTLVTPSPYWPASWPPISREKPFFASSYEIAHEILHVMKWPMCLPFAHHGWLLRYLLRVSATICATFYRIIIFLTRNL